MPVEMRVWTCKYPADSNLNERLREASRQANLPYYKLLARMLDLWEQYQVDNCFQPKDFNVRITKIEKFIKKLTELFTDDLNWKWDSEAEKWIVPDEQHNEIEERPEAESLQIESMAEDQPSEDNQEQFIAEADDQDKPEEESERLVVKPHKQRTTEENQSVVEPEQDEVKSKTTRKKQAQTK